jgi:hypothetical protein
MIKLFVTGLEYKTPISQIYWLFSEYGPIVNITEKVKKLNHKPLNHSISGVDIKSGSCYIETSCNDTAEKILSIGKFKLNNRDIMCSPYKLGKELADENNEKNNRRILLKKVPASVSEEEVKQRVEELFGLVEVFFPFLCDQKRGVKTQTFAKKKQVRSIRTYSVMFRDGESCSLAIQAGALLLADGTKITIEKFSNEYRREKLTKQNQKTMNVYKKPSSGNLYERREKSQDYTYVKKESSIQNDDDQSLLNLLQFPKAMSCPTGTTAEPGLDLFESLKISPQPTQAVLPPPPESLQKPKRQPQPHQPPFYHSTYQQPNNSHSPSNEYNQDPYYPVYQTPQSYPLYDPNYSMDNFDYNHSSPVNKVEEIQHYYSPYNGTRNNLSTAKNQEKYRLSTKPSNSTYSMNNY